MHVSAFALVFLSTSHSTWPLILVGSFEPVFIVHLFQKYLFIFPPFCSPPNGLSLSFASSWSNIPHLPLSQAEKQRLEEALNAAQEEEGSLAAAKRALEARLEEAQRGLTRLGQEQQALNRALEEEGKQREVLRRSKAELEEQKRLLDRTVDRLNKEVGHGLAPAQEEAQLIQKLAWSSGQGREWGHSVWCLLSSSSLLGRPRPKRQSGVLPVSPECSRPPLPSHSFMV